MMQVCRPRETWPQLVVRTEPSTRRIRAVSIEDGGRVEPCRAPKPRQRSNRAASCLMSMSTATPFEAGPNTFKDNVKHLHRGQTTEAAQRLTSCCPLVQEGLSSRTTSNANAARGCPGAAPMARGTSTDGCRPRSCATQAMERQRFRWASRDLFARSKRRCSLAAPAIAAPPRPCVDAVH